MLTVTLPAISEGDFNKGKVELSYKQRQGDKELAKLVFTEEDRKNLKRLSEEVPKLRPLAEELIETLKSSAMRPFWEASKPARKMSRKAGF